MGKAIVPYISDSGLCAGESAILESVDSDYWPNPTLNSTHYNDFDTQSFYGATVDSPDGCNFSLFSY